MAKRFYSAESYHGSESSHGFSNDTIVYVWGSKKARDAYVENSRNLSCQAIERKNVTNWATNYSMDQNKDIKPQPFSGKYWAILPSSASYDGLIGEIGIANCHDRYERFYK